MSAADIVFLVVVLGFGAIIVLLGFFAIWVTSFSRILDLTFGFRKK